MNVWNGIGLVPTDLPPVVASIGKCDGVHVGHHAILDRVIADARRRDVPSVLISFDPHPLAVLAPERLPPQLQTRRQKLDALEDTGLDHLLLLRFDAAVAALDGPRFFDEVLTPPLRFASIWVGETFRFGHRRTGDLDVLSRIGARHGFEVHGVPPVIVDGEPVSSSGIRRLVAAGDVERARRLLGRPYAIGGEVVSGEGRGQELRTPTANLRVTNELLPGNGVYITETVALAARQPSLTNVGVRPTFAGTTRTVETHLLEFEGDLYGEWLEVRFLARLRDEIRFASASDLADQIARDRAAAIAYFQHVRLGPP